MLDLSVESRLERAQLQGFDTSRVWFHGSRSDFVAFDKNHLGRSVNNPTTTMGFFFTDCPQGATYWTERRSRDGSREGQNIIQAFLRTEKTWEIEPDYFQYLLQRAQQRTIDKLCRQAVERGYDSFGINRENGERWVSVFEPTQIRSIHSAFDPEYANDPRLVEPWLETPGARHDMNKNASSEFLKALQP